MNFSGSLFHGIAVLAMSFLASVTGTSGTSATAASFSASTANPAAGSLVQFTDTSGSATSWAWDFGDGGSSTERNSTHVYAAPGAFTVRLTASSGAGPSAATLAVVVTDATVLRLNGAHSFDLTLSARDPRTGSTGVGKVIGQNDVYGYFSLPTLSGNAGNPELIVKMVDATGIGQSYWVFYGTMTDLQFTLSVKENATGAVKTYLQDPAHPSGQFDTSGFAGLTPGPGSPTATPTPTPTSSAQPQTIGINVARFSFTPGTSRPIEVTAGVPTTLVFTSSDGIHGFTGIPALDIAGTNTISAGEPGDPYYGGGTDPAVYRVAFTAPLSQREQSFPFACTQVNYGLGLDPYGHDRMLGVLHVN